MVDDHGVIRRRLGWRGIWWLGTVIATMLWVGWNKHPDDILILILAWLGGVATWGLFSEWQLHRAHKNGTAG